MQNIYLARHGQNEDNANGILNGHRDLPLTDIGIDQAGQVANLIKEAEIRFGHVFTSPLIRASRTADIICEVNNFPSPKVFPELIERDFGDMTGIKQSRIRELCAPDILESETIIYFLSPKGAETFPDLLVRAKILLEKIALMNLDGNILLVSHGDFGKMIYASYYSLNWQDVLTQFHFGNSELLLLSPNSDAKEAHVFKIGQHNT